MKEGRKEEEGRRELHLHLVDGEGVAILTHVSLRLGGGGRRKEGQERKVKIKVKRSKKEGRKEGRNEGDGRNQGR